MRPRRLAVVAAVVVLAIVLVLAGGLPEATFATGSDAPPLVRGVEGVFGPRLLQAGDLGGATACPPALGPALAGEQGLSLAIDTSCVMAVPAASGLLVRPRAVRLRVESGSLRMTVVQRGRGNSLRMADSFASGQTAEASFGERGGTVGLACPSACVLSFEQ